MGSPGRCSPAHAPGLAVGRAFGGTVRSGGRKCLDKTKIVHPAASFAAAAPTDRAGAWASGAAVRAWPYALGTDRTA